MVIVVWRNCLGAGRVRRSWLRPLGYIVNTTDLVNHDVPFTANPKQRLGYDRWIDPAKSVRPGLIDKPTDWVVPSLPSWVGGSSGDGGDNVGDRD